MSQHLATATLDGHPVEIVAGFDRRLGDYFLQVIDERNDMLYTSLQEPLLDWTDIATLRTKVAELGLRLPAQLVDEVEGDGRRRAGNRIVRHHGRRAAGHAPWLADRRHDEQRQQRRGDHAAEHRRGDALITSEPVPLPHTMGTRPARITATVIAFGRTRSTAPSRMASSRSQRLRLQGPAASRASQRVLQVQQHDHAELGGHAGQRDEADAVATDRW
jgi:hypothetical protein